MRTGRPPGRVAGVGTNDMPGWCTLRQDGSNLLQYRTYMLWKNMLKRCYSSKFLEKQPCYKGCTVCDRWLLLSNFAKDIQELPGYAMWRDNPRQRISLDKDTRIEGNRNYRPEACCFLTLADSTRDVARRRYRPECGEHYVRNKAFPAPKPVVCIFPDGHTEKYPSPGAAARANKGFYRRNIALCCEGRAKTYKGCKFYFA